MYIELIRQVPNVPLAEVRIKKRRKDSPFPCRHHAGTIVSEIVDDRSVGDGFDSPRACDAAKHVEQLGAAVETAIAGVGAVGGSVDLHRVDDFVTNAELASNLFSVLDLLIRDRRGSTGHREDVAATQGLGGDREKNGAIDPSGQGDQNSAVFSQQRDCALSFLV
jgi:hypothetical protein